MSEPVSEEAPHAAVIPIPAAAGVRPPTLPGWAGLGDIDPGWEIDTRFIRSINTLLARGHPPSPQPR